VTPAEFEDLRDSIEKLGTGRRSFSFEMETSAALGFGFRCGFLGLLHLEVDPRTGRARYDIDLNQDRARRLSNDIQHESTARSSSCTTPADHARPDFVAHIEERASKRRRCLCPMISW